MRYFETLMWFYELLTEVCNSHMGKVAKLFKTRIKLLNKRPGERYASALTNMNLSNKVYKIFGKISLKNYIKNIVKSRKEKT